MCTAFESRCFTANRPLLYRYMYVVEEAVPVFSCLHCRSTEEDISVSIAGSACDVETVSNTQIVCATGSKKPSMKAPVNVTVGTDGLAAQVLRHARILY